MPRRKETIVVGMSGGVDSSVSAFLLAKAGHRVIGAHMRLCSTENDAALHKRLERSENDARRVAETLDIPFHVLDFHEEFERKVIVPFVEEYLRARTPNPCVMCNPTFKMGAMLEWALENGADALATGHYARIVPDARGRAQLLAGGDKAKDQSYFLCRLTQEKLALLRTPLGEKTKDEVRAIARERGLEVLEKPESQEICFIHDADYRRFLDERLGPERAPGPGNIVDREGNILGAHEGLHYYTIGQRRGIGVSAPRPLYVIELRPERRELVVGPEEALDTMALETGPASWISGDAPEVGVPIRVRVKIRYRSPAKEATLRPLENGDLRVDFREPQRAVTPGQTAAFYDESGERVLGGATIERAL